MDLGRLLKNKGLKMSLRDSRFVGDSTDSLGRQLSRFWHTAPVLSLVSEGCTPEATILFKLKFDKCTAEVQSLNSNLQILALNTVYPTQRRLDIVDFARGDIRLLWSQSLPSDRRSRSTAMSPQTIPRVVPILVNHKCNFTTNRQKYFDPQNKTLQCLCFARRSHKSP